MKKYRVSWIDEVTKEQYVEAESEEEAKKKFFNGECSDFKTLDAEYVEDSLWVEEEDE